MANEGDQRTGLGQAPERELPKRLPQPTMSFRRRAWMQFQRAIDPLARPKPFRIERH
jgi:hypothetical protein